MGFLDKLFGGKAKQKEAEEHLERGIAHSQREDWPKAIQEFEEAVRINPDLAKAHQLLALYYGAVMDKEKALEQYGVLKKLDPKLAQQLANTPAFSLLLRGGPFIRM